MSRRVDRSGAAWEQAQARRGRFGGRMFVLMHVGSAPDGSTLDADALPRLIDEIRASGYRFVAIDLST